jgi:hypothetical protein
MSTPKWMLVKTCRNCNEEFDPYPGKPGYIDQCEDCAKDIPLLGGNMVWSHKTAPELEIKSMAQARSFARKTKRYGAGVTMCLTESKMVDPVTMGRMDPGVLDASKRGTGTEDRAQYVSRLGEKRTVKL